MFAQSLLKYRNLFHYLVTKTKTKMGYTNVTFLYRLTSIWYK